MEQSIGLQQKKRETRLRTNRFSRKTQRQLRQLLLTAAIGGALIAVPQVAMATVVNNGGGNYELQDPGNIVTQVVNDDNATVTTSSNFSVNVPDPPGGDAISITGAGAISYTDDGTGINTVQANSTNATGLGVSSSGPSIGPAVDSSVSITATGTITSVDGGGVNAQGHSFGVSAVDASTMSVTVADVNAANGAVFVKNQGVGDSTVTANGTLIGGGGSGIEVFHTSTGGGDVIINTAAGSNISGGGYGIYVANQGNVNTSDVIINALGTVAVTSPTGVNGIQVTNAGTNSGNVTVNSAAVTGHGDGIQAINFGVGTTSVISNGDVTGQTAVGIAVTTNNTLAGAVSVTTNADVTGGLTGITVDNGGSSSTTINANGNVTGQDSDAIFAYNRATTTDLTVTTDTNNSTSITGLRNGINAQNIGTGNTSITVNKQIKAGSPGVNGDGIYATNGSIANALTIVTTNDVTGTGNGIYTLNSGSGSLDITTIGGTVNSNGPIGNNGGNSAGINAVINNAGSSADITIETDAVHGNNQGISAQNDGIGAITITSNGAVDADINTGIGAIINNVNSLGDVTITANQQVIAGNTGIYLLNSGTGTSTVTASEFVSGDLFYGIYVAANNANAGDVSVDAASVTGESWGVFVENGGKGATDVTTSGNVNATNQAGIRVVATNNLAGAVTVSSNGDVQSGGIFVQNNGADFTKLTTQGDVISGNSDAIYVKNNPGSKQLKLTTNTNTSLIQGSANGIYATNNGTSDTLITINNQVTGQSGNGILVNNAASATDLTITTDTSATTSIQGTSRGINATNNGTGATTITANKQVTGGTSDGIYATNAGTSLTVTAAGVTGGDNGVYAQNNRSGDVSVTTNGIIQASGSNGFGVYAYQSNPTSTANTTVITNQSVTSAYVGTGAQSDGLGNVSVTANASVVGTSTVGIGALITNTNATGDMTVSATDAMGGFYGIFAQNAGFGVTTVTTSGDVNGAEAGVNIGTTANSAATLTIDSGITSIVRNSSNGTTDHAIEMQGETGGTSAVINNGRVRGVAVFAGENATFTNNGTWNSTGGTSDFGGGYDTLINNGNFLAANTTGTSNTIVQGVELVVNNPTGDIIMQNMHPLIGGSTAYVGDVTTFTNGGGVSGGIFEANGSNSIYVDATIVPQLSDELHVDNVITGPMGPTGINVNLVSGLGQPTHDDGVLIVDVNGVSSNDAFVLDHPVVGGLYDYLLGQGYVNTQSWFLQTNARPEAVATGVLPILGSRAALSTLSNLHDRQRDVNVLSNDSPSQKGVWGRVFGQNTDFDGKGYDGFGFNSNLWGAQAGIDLKASGDDKGNRKYAGLYVAYASSSGNARQYGHNVASLDMNATTIGAYYTKYSSNNWYLDAVAQYTMLGGIHAKTASNDISPSGKSYALSLEAGRQYKPDSNIIRELQVQLIDQYTDVDNVTLNDSTRLNLSSLNSVTGRVGLRLYGNPKSGKSFLPWARANIWHTFSGDSIISSMGSSINTPIGGTSGELELGFTKGSASSGGWGIYGSAGYLFDISGAEYSGWKGELGIRKGW